MPLSQDTIFLQLQDNITKTASILEMTSKQLFKTFNITRVQFYALYYILENKNEGITLTALSERMAVTKANITTLMARMERGGLIARISKDRRSTFVVATEYGQNLYQKILPEREKLTKAVFSTFSDQEVAAGNDLLSKIQETLPIAFKNYFQENGGV